MENMNFLADRYIYRNQFKVRTLASSEAISSVYSQLMGLYVLGSGDLLSYTELQTSNPVNSFDYRYWTDELEMAALNHTYQTVPLIELAGISDNILNTEEVCIGVKEIIESKVFINEINNMKEGFLKNLHESVKHNTNELSEFTSSINNKEKHMKISIDDLEKVNKNNPFATSIIDDSMVI